LTEVLEIKDIGDGKKQMLLSVATAHYKDKEGNIKKSIAYSTEVLNRHDPSRRAGIVEYGYKDTQYTTKIQLPTKPHSKMQMAMEMYYKEPIVGTVIDLLVDHSSSGFKNECEDKQIKELYDKWCKSINMDQILKNIFLDYYRVGNVTLYKTNGKFEGKKFPVDYTILNPLHVYIEGSLLFNQEMVMLKPNSDLVNMVKNKDDRYKEILKNLPKDVVSSIKKLSGSSDKIPLNQELVSRITRKKQPYERYASPFLERVFEPVLYKQRLREMDLSTQESLINQLVLVKVGNNEFPATPGELEAIAELLATPKFGMTLIWNHAIEIKVIEPVGINTLGQEKYEQVNDDILTGLGIPKVLLSGEGSNYSTSWVGILSLLERLDSSREDVRKWLENEYKKIAEINGFETYPRVRFNKMNLRQDTFIRNIILAFRDRGLLSNETTLTEAGYDYEQELQRRKDEQEDQQYFVPPQLPFQGQQYGPTNQGRPPGRLENNYPDNRDQVTDPGGNLPKNKQNLKESAFFKGLNEDYYIEDQNIVTNFMSNLRTIEQNDSFKEKIDQEIEEFIVAFSSITTKQIEEIFNTEYTKYYANTNTSYYRENLIELLEWNNGYVNKLKADLREIVSLVDKKYIVNNIQNELEKRFPIFVQEIILNTQRNAESASMEAQGVIKVRWVAILDERTCPICRGLNGQEFLVPSVPSRPHVNCRCTLNYIE